MARLCRPMLLLWTTYGLTFLWTGVSRPGAVRRKWRQVGRQYKVTLESEEGQVTFDCPEGFLSLGTCRRRGHWNDQLLSLRQLCRLHRQGAVRQCGSKRTDVSVRGGTGAGIHCHLCGLSRFGCDHPNWLSGWSDWGEMLLQHAFVRLVPLPGSWGWPSQEAWSTRAGMRDNSDKMWKAWWWQWLQGYLCLNPVVDGWHSSTAPLAWRFLNNYWILGGLPQTHKHSFSWGGTANQSMNFAKLCELLLRLWKGAARIVVFRILWHHLEDATNRNWFS